MFVVHTLTQLPSFCGVSQSAHSFQSRFLIHAPLGAPCVPFSWLCFSFSSGIENKRKVTVQVKIKPKINMLLSELQLTKPHYHVLELKHGRNVSQGLRWYHFK